MLNTAMIGLSALVNISARLLDEVPGANLQTWTVALAVKVRATRYLLKLQQWLQRN